MISALIILTVIAFIVTAGAWLADRVDLDDETRQHRGFGQAIERGRNAGEGWPR